jgi:hypothetical protein
LGWSRSNKAVSSTGVDFIEPEARVRLARTAEPSAGEWAGDSVAAFALFDLYLERLAGFVRKKMDGKFGRRFDLEDVTQSVMGSFFVRLRRGRYDLDESGALW